MAQIKLNQSQFTALSANASFSFSTDRRFAKENPDTKYCTYVFENFGVAFIDYENDETDDLDGYAAEWSLNGKKNNFAELQAICAAL